MKRDKMTLQTLPYDILLIIATFLDLADVHALHLTSRSLRDFSTTRPVYRRLAHDLLARCRPLPLRGFVQPADLSASQLTRSVNQAHRGERQWATRSPRPIQTSYSLGQNPQNSYLDYYDQNVTSIPQQWYRKITLTHPVEDIEVDWLSSITSRYLLCATKSGKVICWDVTTDRMIAEWSLGPRYELWKCRVDFSRRYVYFTMAEKPKDTDMDPTRDITDFEIIQLHFPSVSADDTPPATPQFTRLATCRTVGVVMNFFLLNPEHRTIACFVQIPETPADCARIALYMLLDWAEPFCIFVDTGLEHHEDSNWTCILLEDTLVVHSQLPTGACQHLYPIALLRQYVRPARSHPLISDRVPPFRTVKRNFTYSREPSQTTTPSPLNITLSPEPFPMPPWTAESAHFVRQWWPKFGEGHRASSSVLMLRHTEPETNAHSFAFAQHYFMVPMSTIDLRYPPHSSTSKQKVIEGDPITMWFMHSEYEVCTILEGEEGEEHQERRPLIAVDFGHAVWIEYKDAFTEEKVLRFVTFPPLDADVKEIVAPPAVFPLEIPEDLDLDRVETINLDQSQGTIILSVGGGEVFILCYE